MTATAEAVAAANARARETIARGELLYTERNKIQYMIYRLPLRDLIRLNKILARLSEGDLKRVAAFAEGLAEWNAPETEDAPQEASG